MIEMRPLITSTKVMFFVIVICTVSSNPLIGQDATVDLSPFSFSSTTEQDKMNELYQSCGSNVYDLGSTISFTIDPMNGCTAPVLISMSAMRTAPDPLDPNSYADDEVLVMGPSYSHQFNDEGMFVIFCNPSFKDPVMCITIEENLSGLGPGGAQAVPSLSEWSIIVLSVILLIAALVAIKQSPSISETFVGIDKR